APRRLLSLPAQETSHEDRSAVDRARRDPPPRARLLRRGARTLRVGRRSAGGVARRSRPRAPRRLRAAAPPGDHGARAGVGPVAKKNRRARGRPRPAVDNLGSGLPTAAAAAASPAAASTTAAAILGFVDAQRAPAHVAPIQLVDRLIGVPVVHLHEAEAARAAGFAVGD